jgi:hypothetical protein
MVAGVAAVYAFLVDIKFCDIPLVRVFDDLTVILSSIVTHKAPSLSNG